MFARLLILFYAIVTYQQYHQRVPMLLPRIVGRSQEEDCEPPRSFGAPR